MPRYWVCVASKEHVQQGVAGGFCQVCHGGRAPLARMQPGDYVIYYSPTEKFGKKKPYRKFTAVGKIENDELYQSIMGPDFIPWRRNVQFFAVHDVAIEPLLDEFSFVTNKKRWGLPFRSGLFEISEQDFKIIAERAFLLRT